MCANWGYLRLAEKVRAESIDEMKHADLVISRILFLQGVPNLPRLNKLRIGETVKEQLESDLALEHAAIGQLNGWVARTRELGDHGSEDLVQKILVAEEEHADWLETQLELISQLGEPGYLAQQLH